MSDVIIEKRDGHYLFRPLNDRAAAWLQIAPEDAVHHEDALVVASRDVDMAIAYMERHGLDVDHGAVESDIENCPQ